jgi:hypothetical protein
VNRLLIPPFLLPNPSRVTAGAWTVMTHGQQLEQPSILDGWDYLTPISVSRRLEVDLPGICSDCGLSGSTQFAVTAQWRSTWTDQRGWMVPVQLSAGPTVIAVDLPPAELGGSLHIETCVILLQADGTSDALAPTRPGSILWRNPYSLVLEGEAARFPVELVEFGRAGIRAGSRAAWILYWHPEDLEAAALGTVRLCLNAEHPLIRRMVDGDRHDPLIAAVLSALRFDVARTLIHGALRHEQFTDEEWPEGSLGAVLTNLVHTLFPGESVESLRSYQTLAREEFDARIQAGTRLFLP